MHEPSRPFTPGDLPRHLFQGDDYSNRPGSSYKMNNVVGQAVDEFRNDAMRLGGGSHATLSTTASKQSKAGGDPKLQSMASQEQILEIMQRAETMPKK